MVSDKVLSSLQFNIILAKIADECTLPSSKKVVKEITPSSNLLETNKLLDLTQEAYNLLDKINEKVNKKISSFENNFKDNPSKVLNFKALNNQMHNL